MNVNIQILCFLVCGLHHVVFGNGDTKICLTHEELKALIREEVNTLIDSGELVRRSRSEFENIARNVCEIHHVKTGQSLPIESNNAKRFVANTGTAVGFTACVSVRDLLNLGDQHPIVFDKIITNKGTAYHGHTGIFIAPFKGLYVFHLTAMSSPGKAQFLAFIHDGNVVNHAYPDATGTPGYHTTGSHWVMELEQGSEVWIRTNGAGQIHGNCFTVFSGFLLYEME